LPYFLPGHTQGEQFMAITIHLIGIPLVLLVGLILGGFGGFLLGLRAGAKRTNTPTKTDRETNK
jgi:hypothetical protein